MIGTVGSEEKAKLARDRRWDADEIAREASGVLHAPRWRARAAAPAAETERSRAESGEAEPCETDREGDDEGLAADAPLSQRLGRLKAIIAGAGAAEPPPRPHRAERRALEAVRAERARRAASPDAPDEPWDILAAADRAGPLEAPWRGSG